MTLNLYLYEKVNLIICRLGGVIDSESLLETIKSIKNHPGYKDNINLLMDSGHIDVQLLHEDMIKAVTRAKGIRIGRMGIIARTKLEYGLSRIFQARSTGTGLWRDLKIFKDEELAYKWMNVPSEYISVEK